MLAFAIYVGTPYIASSQSCFLSLNGPPNTDIQFISVSQEGHIFTMTQTAHCLLSTDNGQTWQTRYKFDWEVSDIAAIKWEHILVGYDSHCYRSVNEGESFRVGPFLGDSVAFYILNTWFAIASSKYYGTHFSTDMGYTWLNVNVPFGYDYFLDSQHRLYIAGNKLYRIDSTQIHQLDLPYELGRFTNAFSVYVSKTNTIIVADDSGIFSSSDDGHTWIREGSVPASIRKVYWRDNTVFAPARKDTLYFSSDFGRNWNPIYFGNPYGIRINDFDFDIEGNPLLATSAGLLRVRLLQNVIEIIEQPCEKFFDCSYMTETEPGALLVHSPSYGLHRYTSSGEWERLTAPYQNDGSLLGFAKGAGNSSLIITKHCIYATSDNGSTWIAHQAPDTIIYGRIFDVDSRGYLYMYAGRIYQGQNLPFGLLCSKDNGSSWERVPFITPGLHGIAIDNNDVINAASTDAIYRSTDDGSSWNIISPESKYISYLNTGGDNTLFAVEWDMITAYNNTGTQWRALNIPGNYENFAFVSSTSRGILFAAFDNDNPVFINYGEGTIWFHEEHPDIYHYHNTLTSRSGKIYVSTNSGVYQFDPYGISTIDVIPDSPSLSVVYPNPVTAGEIANLVYSLQQPGNVFVKVYSILGIEVYSSALGMQHSGSHSLTIPTRGMKSGVYQCVATSPHGSASLRMVIK